MYYILHKGKVVLATVSHDRLLVTIKHKPELAGCEIIESHAAYSNIRRKLDKQGEVVGYTISLPITVDGTASAVESVEFYDSHIAAGDDGFIELHAYALAYPEQVATEKTVKEQIAELEAELASLDWRTAKATEEAARLGYISLVDYIGSDDGGWYQAILEQKHVMRTKINELEEL